MVEIQDARGVLRGTERGRGDLTPDMKRARFEVLLRSLPGWRAMAVFVDVDGRWVVAELRFFPDDHSDAADRNPGEWGLRPDVLAHLSQGGLTTELLKKFRISELHGAFTTIVNAAARHVSGASRASPLRPGRRGRDDLDYALTAAAYVTHAALDSRSPIRDLAHEWGVSRTFVRDQMHEVRRRKLLTSLGQGRSGGSLTEKALQLLEAGGN